MAGKKGAALLCVLLLAALLAGCGSKTCLISDLTVTLPNKYEYCGDAPYAGGMDFLYDSSSIVICGIRETREAVEATFGQVDAKEYAVLMTQINELDCAVESRDGLWSFSYSVTTEGTSLTYLCAVYEGTQSFWVVQAYCEAADYGANHDEMWALISSAEVQ